MNQRVEIVNARDIRPGAWGVWSGMTGIVMAIYVLVYAVTHHVVPAIDRNTCVQSGASLAVCKARYSGED